MTKSQIQSPHPYSIRLTTKERQLLERYAGVQPISAYMRSQLFPANDNDPPKPRRSSQPTFRDRKAMAQALALLGRSELSSSLREMARLAHLGALPMTPDTEVIIQQACREVSEIKSLLMKGLGVKED